MVLPSWSVTSVAQARFNAALGSPAIEQLELAEFISSGLLIGISVTIVPSTGNGATFSLRRSMRMFPRPRLGGIAADLHLVATFPKGIDEIRLVEAAAARSVAG
jgi:GntR family transcriptional regulator / MocR family aminotransferase